MKGVEFSIPFAPQVECFLTRVLQVVVHKDQRNVARILCRKVSVASSMVMAFVPSW